MSRIEKNYTINPENIDEISRQARDFLSSMGIGSEVCLRTGFVIEESLISVMDSSAEPVTVTVLMMKKFRKPVIQIEYKGERFDPANARKRDELTDLILGHLGVTVTWGYKFGVNRLTFKLPSQGISSEILLISSIVLAAILGSLGAFIPENLRNTITGFVLDPVSDLFMKLLIALAPVLVFLSIISGIVRGKDGADFSKIGRYIIVRYIGVSLASMAAMVVFLLPFFTFNHDSAPLKISSFSTLADLLFNLIPDNIITPFSDNNVMQIIIMAVFFGGIMLGLGDRVGGLNSLTDDLYKVFLNATELVCNTLPVFVFTSLLSVLWKNGFGMFIRLWKPILVSMAGELFIILIYLIVIAIKLKVSPVKIIKKIMPSFIVGVSTCSSIAAFTKGSEINKKSLGIKASYSDLAYPLGISLFEASFTSFFLTITYYLAEAYKTPVSTVWFITAGFICIIVSYASPQVSGGVLVSLGIILAQLNIPAEGLAVAGTLALILDFFSTGSKIAGQHLEMILQADHLDMLDRNILRK